MSRSAQIERAFESDAGKVGFKLYMVVITLLLTVLMTIITSGVSHMNNGIDAAAAANIRQDQQSLLQAQNISFNTKQIAAMQAVSAQQVRSLQEIVTQMTVLSDHVQALQTRETRPRK